MLYIRVDGNTEIGMGHVMRCLSVAEAAEQIGQPPVFLTADEGCRGMIEERGFSVIVLNTDYKDMISELPVLESILNTQDNTRESDKRDILLVDSYQVSRKYYLALRQFAKVACFEDLGKSYPVDLLINYNIYAPDLEQIYKLSDVCPDKLLLGVEYMPLRKAFQIPSEYRVSDTVTSVTITTGGSDPYFAAAALADALIDDDFIKKQKIHLHLISGPFNKFANELKKRYKTCENVTIHENVKDMRSLLLDSDVVISATGSTIYEVSALGVPMIVFYFAENQRQGAEALERLTDIVNAGCFAENGKTVVQKAAETLKKCIRDKSYRILLNQQEKRLIDGKGASRIVKKLMEMR